MQEVVCSMNLKEYNYCKRHHPQALARYLGIRVNTFECINDCSEIHDAGHWWKFYEPPPDSSYHYLDVNRWLTLTYLV